MALKKTIIEPSWEAKYSFSPAVVTEGGNKRSKEQHCRVFGYYPIAGVIQTAMTVLIAYI
jgi:hypothetical protein